MFSTLSQRLFVFCCLNKPLPKTENEFTPALPPLCFFQIYNVVNWLITYIHNTRFPWHHYASGFSPNVFAPESFSPLFRPTLLPTRIWCGVNAAFLQGISLCTGQRGLHCHHSRGPVKYLPRGSARNISDDTSPPKRSIVWGSTADSYSALTATSGS